MPVPMTNIGGIEVSRVICGTNPFFGFSHFSKAKDEWMQKHFTDERILEVLEACRLHGINTTLSSPSERYAKILREHERQTGHHWVWMSTPGALKWVELKDLIKWTSDLGAELCMPHQMFTDSHLLLAENRILHAEDVTQAIRDNGMVPGWSAHRPEVITTTDENNYDIETYITPYNPAGFLCQVETDWTGSVIRNAKKPVTVIKPLGAGRVMPPTGIEFAFNGIKNEDPVAIGFMSPGEVNEDVEIAMAAMERRSAETELQFTRSKTALAR